MKEFVDMDAKEAEFFMSEKKNQPVRDKMAEIVGDGTVVDFGCGKGIMVKELFRKSKYIGFDCSEELIKIAKKDNPSYIFRVFDVKNLRVDKKVFDFAIIKSVLEHTPSLKDAKVVYENALSVARTVLVAWHTPPYFDNTKIIQLKADLKLPIYQNNYKKGSFDIIDVDIKIVGRFGDFELWKCKRK